MMEIYIEYDGNNAYCKVKNLFVKGKYVDRLTPLRYIDDKANAKVMEALAVIMSNRHSPKRDKRKTNPNVLRKNHESRNN